MKIAARMPAVFLIGSIAAPKLIQCNDEPDTPLTMNTPPY